MSNSLKHLHPWSRIWAGLAIHQIIQLFQCDAADGPSATCSCHPANALGVPFFARKTKSPGAPRALSTRSAFGDRTAEQIAAQLGASITAAEERPEPIVQTNFEHLNLAARGEVSPRKGPGPNVRSSSLRKSYSSFADQFPPNAHSTPAPTTQPLFRLDALIEAPVFRFVMVESTGWHEYSRVQAY